MNKRIKILSCGLLGAATLAGCFALRRGRAAVAPAARRATTPWPG